VIINDLLWDDENVEHIARHNVTPKEVEDVCYGFHISKKERRQRYILSGQTRDGRYLNVVIEKIGKELFRPITAFEMSEKYKAKFKKRLKK
jgi:uncharacterized DUF497 family protein